MTLLDRHVEFVGALRTAGLAVSPAEGIDAANAVGAIELIDREQLRAAYAAALVKRQAHRPAFDTVFDLYFPMRTDPDGSTDLAEPAGPSTQRMTPDVVDYRARLSDALLAGDESALDQLAQEGVSRFGRVGGQSRGTQTWSRYTAANRISTPTLMAGLLQRFLQAQHRDGLAERNARTTFAARMRDFDRRLDSEVARRLAAQSSPAQVARTAVRPSVDRLDLQSATRADLTAIRREIQPLARRLAARLAIEQRRGRRGPLDFRRTMRASLSTGGIPMDTVQRPRRPRKTDLVVLCDVSESVAAFARFTLLLVFALREQFTRVRVFAFVDELDEVTSHFGPGADVLGAVESLAGNARVRGWSGRTDYGRVLGLFDERFHDAITARSSLLVLGDARSNYGDVALPVLARLAERARRAYWLNPERRSVWNTGDSAAAEVGGVVPMVECRNLAQLAGFVRDLV